MSKHVTNKKTGNVDAHETVKRVARQVEADANKAENMAKDTVKRGRGAPKKDRQAFRQDAVLANMAHAMEAVSLLSGGAREYEHSFTTALDTKTAAFGAVALNYAIESARAAMLKVEDTALAGRVFADVFRKYSTIKAPYRVEGGPWVGETDPKEQRVPENRVDVIRGYMVNHPNGALAGWNSEDVCNRVQKMINAVARRAATKYGLDVVAVSTGRGKAKGIRVQVTVDGVKQDTINVKDHEMVLSIIRMIGYAGMPEFISACERWYEVESERIATRKADIAAKQAAA